MASRPPETDALVRLAGALTAAMRGIIDSSAVAGLGPMETARILGLDKTSTSRLMASLRVRDPFVALSLLPGVVPMRQFVSAVKEHGAGSRAVQTAERSLDRFGHELQRAFGTRTRLDAAITDALPEARRRHEEAARQAVYRGMALIKGVSMDLESYTWVIHPSRQNPKRVDMLFLAAFVGIHRLRPTARVRLASFHIGPGRDEKAGLLREFCRPAGVSVATSTEEKNTVYEISTGSVRRDAAADIFLSEFHPGAAPRRDPNQENRVWSVGELLNYPIKRFEMTLLVHEDAWPGCEFALTAYDTAGRGWIPFPDPSGDDPDRLSLDAELIRSPAEEAILGASPVPQYAEILRHVTAPLGWSFEISGRPAFRMFRCEIAYPLYGSQMSLVRE